MVKKLITVSDEVATKLEAEDNSSALVDSLLHIHYGIPLAGEGRAADARAQIIEDLTNEPIKAETVPPAIQAEVVAPPVAQPVEVQPVIEEEPQHTNTTPNSIPEPLEPTMADLVGPGLKVRVMGQPAEEEAPTPNIIAPAIATLSQICPTCGNAFVPPTCLNCI